MVMVKMARERRRRKEKNKEKEEGREGQGGEKVVTMRVMRNSSCSALRQCCACQTASSFGFPCNGLQLHGAFPCGFFDPANTDV